MAKNTLNFGAIVFNISKTQNWHEQSLFSFIALFKSTIVQKTLFWPLLKIEK
jgi:hypothetical protein